MARIFSRLRLLQNVFAKEGVPDCGNPQNFPRKCEIASRLSVTPPHIAGFREDELENHPKNQIISILADTDDHEKFWKM